MKKLLQFSVIGVTPVPWSVPNIGVANRGGKRIRFARRSKKSRLHEGKASLDDWQKIVNRVARHAMAEADLELQVGPVWLHMAFTSASPIEEDYGTTKTATVKWLESKKKWVKKAQGGKTPADLTNLVKGTEDALSGVLFGDDVQNRMISAISIHGPFDGVEITAYAIEPDDIPGDYLRENQGTS